MKSLISKRFISNGLKALDEEHVLAHTKAKTHRGRVQELWEKSQRIMRGEQWFVFEDVDFNSLPTPEQLRNRL